MDTQKRGGGDHDGTVVAAADGSDAAYMAEFGARVRELRGMLNQADFGSKLGIHTNTVGKIERGLTLPDALLALKMCRLGGRSISWLLDGSEVGSGGQAAAEAETLIPPKSLTAVEKGGFVWVPLFDILVSAGNGAFNDIERVITMRPFDVAFIRGDLRIQHNAIAMFQVIGDSAVPQLSSKDTVLVDCRDCDVLTEGLHMIRLDGALFAKRVQRLPGRVLRVSSNNEAYAPFEISGSDEHDRDFAVIGRIRWGGVTFQ